MLASLGKPDAATLVRVSELLPESSRPCRKKPIWVDSQEEDPGGPQGEEEGASLGSVLLLSAVESTLGSGGRAGMGLQGPSPAPWRRGHQLSP